MQLQAEGPQMNALNIAFGSSAFSSVIDSQQQLTFDQLADYLEFKPLHVGKLPHAEYVRHAAFPKDSPEQKAAAGDKDTQWFSLATYRDAVRKNANVESVSGFGVDLDTGQHSMADIARILSGFKYLAHTTHSHSATHAKFRVIVPYAQPVTPADHDRLWRQHFNPMFGGTLDANAKDASRLWYFPSCCADTRGLVQRVAALDGALFDPVPVLAAMPPEPPRARDHDWTTEPAWPAPLADFDQAVEARKLRSPVFAELMEGNLEVLAERWSKPSGECDQSKADYALACELLQLNGGNCEATVEYMRTAGLKLWRDRWNDDAWLGRTVNNAYITLAADPTVNPLAAGFGQGPRPAGMLDERKVAPIVVPTGTSEIAIAAAVDQVLLAGGYTKAKSGVIHGTVRNAVVYLTGIPWMAEVFYDEFSQRIFYQGQEWQAAQETPQLLAIQASIPAVSPDTFARAVEAIALSQRRDRLKDWVEALPLWDGKKRLTLWLKHAFGCPTDRYHMRVARNWLISMVARALEPGCKVDTMPVMEGVQGKLKSSALEALAHPFFVEASGLKFGDRDFMMTLTGAWLVELPELSTLRNADVDSIKATLSRKVDRYRAPYARRESDHPRRFVFAGSVNGSDYLRDDTGNRRFLPIECTTVNIGWIRANRDMLFAEALTAYSRRPMWWHFPKAATAEMQDSRLPSDPWASRIAQWIAANPHKLQLTSDDIHNAVAVPTERRSRGTETRIGRVMAKNFPQWRKTRPYIATLGRQGERVWEFDVPLPPAPT
jgi:hypothetical protein